MKKVYEKVEMLKRERTGVDEHSGRSSIVAYVEVKE
jgi:hypothetical protein